MSQSPDDATPDCPDAVALAAYYDRSLIVAERAHLEDHFADCARCQMQLAAIARADTDLAPAATRSPVTWLRGWRLAIPALAAAAALLIAIRVTRHTESVVERDQLLAMAKPQAAANSPATASVSSSSNAPSENTASAPALNLLALNEQKRPPAEPRAAELPDRPQQIPGRVVRHAFANPAGPRLHRAEPSQSDTAAAKSETEPVPSLEATAPSTTSPSAPAALAMREDARPSISPAASPAPQTSLGAASIGAIAGSAASAAAGAGAITGNTAGTTARAYAGRAADPGFSVVLSVQDHTWEIGARGKISRSIRGGDFVAQHSGVTTDLLAGAATSPDVCWIAGRAGTVLRTTDGGTNWQKIASPTDDDITRIAANGADEAIVTTANGQSFATSDGGATWHPQ